MKKILLTIFIFFAFVSFANAGELYECVDRDGTPIITSTPTDGMKCIPKESYVEPSPEERLEKEKIERQHELAEQKTQAIETCKNKCKEKLHSCETTCDFQFKSNKSIIRHNLAQQCKENCSKTNEQCMDDCGK